MLKLQKKLNFTCTDDFCVLNLRRLLCALSSAEDRPTTSFRHKKGDGELEKHDTYTVIFLSSPNTTTKQKRVEK